VQRAAQSEVGQLFQVVQVAIAGTLDGEDVPERLDGRFLIFSLLQESNEILRLRICGALGRHAAQELLRLVVLSPAISQKRAVIVDLRQYIRGQSAELVVVGLVQYVGPENFIAILIGDRDRALDGLVIVRM